MKVPIGRRVSTGGTLDVYTALALAGLFCVIVLTGSLWIAGSDLATAPNQPTQMPWAQLPQK